MKYLVNYWQSLAPLTKTIYVFILFNTVLINLVLSLLFTPKHTVIGSTINFLLAQQKSDSWSPMIYAFHYLQSAHSELLYSKIFFEEHIKFQYPPTSLIIFSGLSNIIPKHVPKTEYLKSILNGTSWLFIFVMIGLTIKIFKLSLEKTLPQQNRPLLKGELLSIYLLIFCLTLTFFPVIKAYSLGQIQAWCNSLFAIAIWGWLIEKKEISGIALGVMCLIKPQYFITLIWGILHKQWSFIKALVATILVGLTISISLFGLANHLNYLSVLSFISKHGEAYQANQSINGLLNRLLLNGEMINFQRYSFPPFHPLVYIGTTISSIGLIYLALFYPRKARVKGTTTDFSIIALTGTIASPVAWEHHYGILLPIYAFLLPCLLKRKNFEKMTVTYLCISYVLCSNYFQLPESLLTYTPFNIIRSYVLASGLMVLGCLYALRNSKVNEDSIL